MSDAKYTKDQFTEARQRIQEAGSDYKHEDRSLVQHVVTFGTLQSVDDGNTDSTENGDKPNSGDVTEQNNDNTSSEDSNNSEEKKEDELTPEMIQLQQQHEELLIVSREKEIEFESLKRTSENTRKINDMLKESLTKFSTNNSESYKPLKKEDYDSDFDFVTASNEHMQTYMESLNSGQSNPNVTETLQNIEDTIKKDDTGSSANNDTGHKKSDIVDELSRFWKSNKDFDPGVSIEEATTIHNDVYAQIKTKYQCGDAGVRKILSQINDPVIAESTIGELRTKGIEINDSFIKIKKSIDIFNYKNGEKVLTNGEFCKVRGASGDVQNLTSMDDAYFLMNRRNLLGSAIPTATKDIQKQLEITNSGAVQTSSKKLDDFKSEELSYSEMSAVLTMAQNDPYLAQRDPAFKEKLDTVRFKIEKNRR